MSQKNADTSTDQQNRRRRFRDFLILTLGGVSVLALLFVTGAIGFVEGITGAIVMSAGAMAYFVGSLPASPETNSAAILAEPEPVETPPDESAIAPFIMSLPFAVLLIDEDSRIETANAYARTILRLKRPEGDLASASLRQPDLLSAIERVQKNGANELVEFTLHGEAEVWMAHVQQGPSLGTVFVVFEDLTAVRRAERARADFLANASHELRTPLTAVGGFIETMRGPAKNDKDSWDGFLDIMHQQTERMKRLVADLLSLSRIEFSEHRAPSTKIEVRELARNTSLSLQPLADEAKISLHFDAPDADIYTIADADEFAQIIQNLAGNAIKYASPKGEVQILIGISNTMSEAAEACSRQSPQAKRALLLDPYASAEMPALWIRITDNGDGIPEEHLPRLGERFYRVDESRGGKIEGTGLGLAIVKHIMARHRGGFAVESITDEGTAFGVWMPRTPDHEP